VIRSASQQVFPNYPKVVRSNYEVRRKKSRPRPGAALILQERVGIQCLFSGAVG
jgi:hypothetical protein